jgi:nitronate monooxygenase
MHDDPVRALAGELRLPLIAAPMTGVSGIDLVRAGARAGIAASFPMHNAGGPDHADRWLATLHDELDATEMRRVLPNLVVHRSNARLEREVDVVIRHGVSAVITSVGSPASVADRLHDGGILVLADVASIRHAERAIAAGVDALVLLAAGGGGQTGWANPLSFARAVRAFWDGPLVLAGGVSDGASLLAALAAGYDLAYMGTAFIATAESTASEAYKDAVVVATMDDIELTSALTGLPTSLIRSAAGGTAPAVSRSGSTTAPQAPMTLPRSGPMTTAAQATRNGPFSAGHSVAGVAGVVTVEALIERVERELAEARVRLSC